MAMTQKRLIAAVALSVGLGAFGASDALAIPIAGKIDFAGGMTLVNASGAAGVASPANADGATFSNPIDILESSSTGAYAGLPGSATATFTNLTGGNSFGDPGVLSALSVSPFWTFTVGPVVYSFAITSVTSNSLFGPFRLLSGSGIASISGGTYDPTQGTWTLSTNGSGSTTLGFSSSATVPDGGTTAALFGSALLALWVVRRRLVA